MSSTPNATTFRFQEETREELERIKEHLNTPILQKTVEVLIHRFLQDRTDYDTLFKQYQVKLNQYRDLESQVHGLKRAFRSLMDEGGDHG
jgi:hypothetical protein